MRIKILPTQTWRILLFLCVLSALLSGCEKQNTKFSPGFNQERFKELKVGMSETEVIQQLGPGFYRSYLVQYPNGSQNIVLKKPTAENENLVSYEIHYSDPINERADFESVGVIFDKTGKFIRVNRYITD